MDQLMLNDDIAALARVADLGVDAAHLPLLVPFAGALRGIIVSLGAVDVRGAVPSTVFDARWEA